jgi:hypothetical protein
VRPVRLGNAPQPGKMLFRLIVVRTRRATTKAPAPSRRPAQHFS